MAEEQRVEALALQKKELQDEADELEKQIFNLERKYLEDTREYGNVVVGWSQLTGAKPARDRLKVSTQNFLFSLSSVTSPASGSGSAGSGKRGGAGATSKRPPKKGKKEASSPAGPAAPLTAGSDNQVTEARDGGSSGTPRKGRGKSGGAARVSRAARPRNQPVLLLAERVGSRPPLRECLSSSKICRASSSMLATSSSAPPAALRTPSTATCP